jgi:hypothetical protein
MTVPASAIAAVVPAIVPMTIAVIPAGIPVAVTVMPLWVVVIAARGGVIPPMTPVAVPVVPIAVVPVPAVPSPVIPTAPDIGEAVTHIAVVAADIHEDPNPVVMRHRCGTEPEQEQSNQSGAQHVETLGMSTIRCSRA